MMDDIACPQNPCPYESVDEDIESDWLESTQMRLSDIHTIVIFDHPNLQKRLKRDINKVLNQYSKDIALVEAVKRKTTTLDVEPS